MLEYALKTIFWEFEMNVKAEIYTDSDKPSGFVTTANFF